MPHPAVQLSDQSVVLFTLIWQDRRHDFDPRPRPTEPEQLRALAAQLLQRVSALDEQVETMGKTVQVMDKKIHHDKTLIEKLSHEIAQLKRFKFAKRSEQMSPEQASLLDDLIDTDIAAIEAELESLRVTPAPGQEKQKPKRRALPPEFPRTLIHHEPDNTDCTCGCALKRIGEDVSEKLDYTPGVFTVERHIRGKWVCDSCETLIQAPVPAQVIDKGIPTAGLLAHVMIAKFADHRVSRTHARRKFFDLHAANKSQLAEQALLTIGALYEVERQAKDMREEDRRRIRQRDAVPIAEKLHDWMLTQRELVPEGSAIAKALDYSLKRWIALTRYLDDGALPIDNNHVEVRHEVAYRSCSPWREPPVSPGESRRLNQERLRQWNEAPQVRGTNRERRTLLAAIAGQVLDSRYGEHM